MSEAVASLRGVSKVFRPSPAWMRILVRTQIRDEIRALSDVDLDLAPGQICAVVGPNGAGKTTMFRILTGLTTPTSGTGTVLGFDVHHESEAVRRVIGWMPAEDRSLFMRLSCRENLYFHGRLQSMAPRALKQRIPEILDEVGLGERAANAVFSLSAGMRARLQLARAMLHRPKLLILDEPTASVDPVGAHELLKLITKIVEEQHLAALISSHRLEEIEALHSHVVLLDRGRIRYQGDLDELRAQWDRPWIEIAFRASGSAQRATALLNGYVEIMPPSDGRIRCRPARGVTTGDILRDLGNLTADIEHVRELRLPLRDLLAQLYRAQPALTGESR